MNSTATAQVRIARSSVEAGMALTVTRTLMGQERVVTFTPATVRKAGDWTVCADAQGRQFSLTSDDVIHLTPAEGEVWA